MYYSSMIFSILAFVATSHAHMEMSFPPPFRSKNNPFYGQSTSEAGKIDYSMTSPLSGAAQFPCKGYQSDLGTPGGASVVTWNQGAAVNFTIEGSASHSGGSCQAALSYDSGKSFTVIHSYIGGCPLTPNWALTIPSDAPKGAALFAWTWYNEVGNREIYMNCASITIGAGSSKKRAASVAFKSRPDLFVANLANGCTTIETEDVVFPNPGPDVTGTSTKTGTGFSGTCAAVNGIGGGSTSGSSGVASGAVNGGTSASAPAASSPAPVASSPSPVASSPAPVASSPSPTASSSPVATSTQSEVLTIIPVTTSASAVASGFITSTTGGSAPSSSTSGGSVPSPSTSGGSAPSSVASVPTSSVPTGSTPAATGSTTSGVKVSADGQCSGSQTCAGSTFGQCCSQWGWCGVTTMHCGTGCMEAFSGSGACGGATTNSTVPAVSRVRAVKARGFLA